MAQLSDDALAFGGELLSVDAVIAAFRARLAPVAEAERVGIGASAGRILAADIAAPLPIPSFDNSAVDGYAVRIADVAADAPTRLRIVDRVIAGDAATVTVGAGEAARVFTGAPLPPGADTVYMQEDVRTEEGAVVVPPGLKRGANARFVGEDLPLGAVALAAGRRLRPEDVALAAALGLADLPVRRRLRVAVFSTGNEVTEPGRPLPPAALYDANRYMLRGLLQTLGCEVSDLGILRDDAGVIATALREAAGGHDLILTSGGVSTGEEDHVKAAVESVGRLDFWRIAIKPGRPVALGLIGGGSIFAGLPGNPVAVFVTFTQVVRPLIATLAGEAWTRPPTFPVRAGFAYKKKAGRREYVRVRLTAGADGWTALKHAQDGAGVITSLTASDGLVELAEGVTRVSEGDAVGFVPFALLD